MKFSQSFIDDLKRQADIVRLISDYVPLKKKGANWMACCPFHGEKTPSFSVNPAKGIFYCFGCGKKGSAFNFVMEIERVSFPEAIRIVAEKSGVPLPQMETGAKAEAKQKEYEARKTEAEAIINFNNFAVEFWENLLKAEKAESVFAREYVATRGISEPTRQAFRLGYAPKAWDALLNHLKEKGASDKQLEASGLIIKKDDGRMYDRFRGRVMFPVLDVRGRAVAFGARAIHKDDEPKYLNSPETAAYTKGQHLYGLFQAQSEIKKRRFAILVEGYLDLIALYQVGITNVVASLGTSLTEAQAKLLGRFTRKVVVNYDGDKAGRSAARRATEILLTQGFEVKVLVLADNADPDDFIRSYGVDEYHKQRGAAVSHIQFTIDEATRERDLNNGADKAAAVEEILPSLRAVKNPIQKREFFDQTMDALRLDSSLRPDIWKQVAGKDTAYRSVRANAERSGDESEFVLPRVAPTLAEERLLELLAGDAIVREYFLPQLVATDYGGLAYERIFAVLHAQFRNGEAFDLSRVQTSVEDDASLSDYVSVLMLSESRRERDEAADEILAEAQQCLMTLRSMSVEKRLREMGVEIAHAERTGNQERLFALLNQRLELTRTLPTLVRSQAVSVEN